jgi:hypothetical protein
MFSLMKKKQCLHAGRTSFSSSDTGAPSEIV